MFLFQLSCLVYSWWFRVCVFFAVYVLSHSRLQCTSMHIYSISTQNIGKYLVKQTAKNQILENYELMTPWLFGSASAFAAPGPVSRMQSYRSVRSIRSAATSKPTCKVTRQNFTLKFPINKQTQPAAKRASENDHLTDFCCRISNGPSLCKQ